jgi:hypothetical protein
VKKMPNLLHHELAEQLVAHYSSLEWWKRFWVSRELELAISEKRSSIDIIHAAVRSDWFAQQTVVVTPELNASSSWFKPPFNQANKTILNGLSDDMVSILFAINAASKPNSVDMQYQLQKLNSHAEKTIVASIVSWLNTHELLQSPSAHDLYTRVLMHRNPRQLLAALRTFNSSQVSLEEINLLLEENIENQFGELLDRNLIHSQEDLDRAKQHSDPYGLLRAINVLGDYRNGQLLTHESYQGLLASTTPALYANQLIVESIEPQFSQLGDVANDIESNIRPLNETKQYIFNKVCEHYRQHATRIDEVIEALAERYQRNPIHFDLHGNSITLPLLKTELAALSLAPNDELQAWKAYYQHPTHTLWRYLCAQRHMTQYEEGDSEQKKIARLELIALMWFAVNDKEQVPPVGGVLGDASNEERLDSRVQLFIQGLAMSLARAHNWDLKKIPQKDDLLPDAPSCGLRIDAPIFEAVVGHPLFERLLTPDKLKEHVRTCIRHSLQTYLMQMPGRVTLFREVCTAYQDVGELSVEQQAILRAANVSSDERAALIQKLQAQYDVQDCHLVDVNAYFDSVSAHCLFEARWGDLLGLLDNLEPNAPRLSQQGLFSGSCPAVDADCYALANVI